MANGCCIEFDQNEYGTYFTGQVLSGKFIINLNKPKNFKGIKLQISGYAQCHWRERHGRKKPLHKKNIKMKHTFFGHEAYIASTTFLVGSEGEQIITIDSGRHTYTFSCPIPFNCPSSYEGTYGHIRYIVKVTCIKSGSSNRTYRKGFTVLKLLDLNRESTLLKSPACIESFENVCFLNSKAVHLKVVIPQTGYVPGQVILVSAYLNNASNFDVKNLLITLILRATYMSDTPCMHCVSEKLFLVKKYCGPVAYKTIKSFAEIIRVPATPPTCDHLSKVVRISYEISVKALMNHFINNPKIIIPITIGNVPLVYPTGDTEPIESDDMPATSAIAVQSPVVPNCNLLREEVEADYELPPPSYEEAIFMTTNITDDDINTLNENVQYTPRYPVYDVDNIIMSNAMAQTPTPNHPQKRRKKKKAVV